MSWHHLAMCRPPPTLPRLQILVKSMKINENTCPGINWQCASLPHPPKPSNPPEINGNQRKSIKIRVLASIGNVQAFPTLYISRNHQAPSQIACMMETSMQKKRSAAEAQPINIYMNILVLSVCMFESLHSPIAISWLKHLCMCVHHCRPVHGEHRYPGVFPCTKPHEQE